MNFHSVVCSSGVVVVLSIYGIYILEKSITVQCQFHQCMLQVCEMNGYGYVKSCSRRF